MISFFRKSFKGQLLLGFISVSVLPVLLSSLFLIRTFTYRINMDQARKDQQQLELLESTLSQLLKEEEEAVQNIAEREMLRDALENGYGNRTGIYNFLFEETGGLRQTARFDLYSAEGICQYSTASGMYERMLPTYWGNLRAATENPESLIYAADTEGEEQVLTLTKAIPGDHGKISGYVVATIRESGFDTIFSPIVGGRDSFLIMNGFLEPVYQLGRVEASAISSTLRTGVLEDEKLPEQYGENRVYVRSIGDSGLYMLLLLPLPLSDEIISSMYRISIVFAFISIVLSLLAASWISSRIFEPIQRLNQAMAEVRKGKLKTHVETTREDELGELTESFNVMTENLDLYMERQLMQQKELNEVQIAMMQAQLNPHFLYNTLDTMKWMAKAHHVPEIATMSQKLAKILRTSISSTQFIPLKEEIALVESYSEIQKIRFEGKFDIECTVPEELENILIPKLIVQPIVENAVIHGLRETEKGRITVDVSQDNDGRLCIVVCDDGVGISEEALLLLKQRDKDKRKGHIGFYNVDSILRMYYGEEYGLKVRNRDEGGAEVTMILPIRENEVKM